MCGLPKMKVSTPPPPPPPPPAPAPPPPAPEGMGSTVDQEAPADLAIKKKKRPSLRIDRSNGAQGDGTGLNIPV